MTHESVPISNNEREQQFESRKKEIIRLVRNRLGSALVGDFQGYVDTCRKIVELEIEGETASIDDVRNDPAPTEADKISTINATQRDIEKLRDFLMEVDDPTKMRERMEREKKRIEDGDGIFPVGIPGSWFGSTFEILKGIRISDTQTLEAYLDEEPQLKG